MKIYLIGFMGSGKTYWGQQLSQKLNIPFFDMDEQIVNSEGKSINEIFEKFGEEYFRLKEKRDTSYHNRNTFQFCDGLWRRIAMLF
jgi:shikimate kinase